jgi:hypothetical protein
MVGMGLLAFTTGVAQVPVPPTGCYHSAFTPAGQSAFEALAEKSIAIEMDYRAWAFSADFPAAAYAAVIQNGAIPHMTWELSKGDVNNGLFSNQRIIDGLYDAYLQR